MIPTYIRPARFDLTALVGVGLTQDSRASWISSDDTAVEVASPPGRSSSFYDIFRQN